MRRLNIKFLVGLLVSTACLVAIVIWVHSSQVTATDQMWLDNVARHKQEGNLRDAAIDLRKYLHRNRKDQPRKIELAEIYTELWLAEDGRVSDYLAARSTLQDATRYEAAGSESKSKLIRSLVDVLVKAGNYTDALPYLETLLAVKENDPELQFIAAQACFQRKHEARLLKHLSSLVGYVPFSSGVGTEGTDGVLQFSEEATALDNIEAHMLLASYFRKLQKQPFLADQVVERMVKLNPESSLALLEQGKWLQLFDTTGTRQFQQDRYEEGSQAIKKALELSPDDMAALLANAKLSMDMKEPELALGYLQRAEKLYPQDEQIYFAFNSLMQKDGKAALSHLDRGIAQVPESKSLVWLKGMRQVRAGDKEGAGESLKLLQSLKGRPLQITLLESEILIADGEWGKAIVLLEKFRPLVANLSGSLQQVDLQLGTCYSLEGDIESQRNAFQRALDEDPRSVKALTGLAGALRELDQVERAFHALQDFFASIPPEQHSEYGDLFQQYMRFLGDLRAKYPDNENYDNIALQIESQMEGQETSDEIEKGLVSAREFVRSGKLSEAIELLEELRTQVPQGHHLATKVQSNLVSLANKQSGPAAALKMLDSFGEDALDSVDSRLWRARVVMKIGMKTGDLSRIRQLSEIEQGIDEFEKKDQAKFWNRLGTLYLSLGEDFENDAKRCCRSALALQPRNKETAGIMFDLALAGSEEEMRSEHDAIEKTFGRDTALWKYAEASRLLSLLREEEIDLSELQKVERLIRDARELSPKWYRLVRLGAEVSDFVGNYRKAINEYTEALDLGPWEPQALHRLIRLQILMSDWDGMRDVLRKVGASVAGMERHKVMLLVMTATADSHRDVAEAIESLVPQDLEDWDSQHWKGYAYRRLARRLGAFDATEGYNKQAEAAFRRALEINPDVPQTWISLVTYLSEIDQEGPAEQIVRRAENYFDDEVAAMLLARSYVFLKNDDRAEHFYLSVYEADPSNPSRLKGMAEFYLDRDRGQEAVSYLEKLIDHRQSTKGQTANDATEDSLPPEVMWARRQLADMLSKRGNHEEFLRSLDLIKQNQIDGNLGVPDIRLKAKVLAWRQGEPRYQIQAIELLEEAHENNYLDPADKLLLAELYHQANRWDECRVLMNELYGSYAKRDDLLFAYGAMLLAREEIKDAAREVQNLRRIAPRSQKTIRLASRYELMRDRKEAAMAEVQKLMPEKIEEQTAGAILQVASLLEELGFYEEAEQKYRLYQKHHPSGKLQLAGFLARQGDPKDAIALANTLVKPETMIAICQLGVELIERLGSEATTPQKEQVARWIQQGRKVRPTSIRVALIEAKFAHLTDEIGRAEAICRNMLARPKLSSLQRGTVSYYLAYLLATNNKNLPEALRLVTDSIRLAGPSTSTLDTRALVFLAQGHCSLAIRDLTEATSMSGAGGGMERATFRTNNFANIYFHLALAHQCAGDLDEAAIAIEQAKHRGFSSKTVTKSERPMWNRLEEALKKAAAEKEDSAVLFNNLNNRPYVELRVLNKRRSALFALAK